MIEAINGFEVKRYRRWLHLHHFLVTDGKAVLLALIENIRKIRNVLVKQNCGAYRSRTEIEDCEPLVLPDERMFHDVILVLDCIRYYIFDFLSECA